MSELTIDQKAPNFSLMGQDNKNYSLKDFSGKWLVLYFYPKDNTPGCTLEAIEFTQQLSKFEKLKANVVGVSADSLKSHQSFCEKKKLEILLLSDPEREALDAYGVWKKKSLYGRTFLGIVRSTFLIDPKGKIAFIWPKVKVAGHVAEVLEKIKELQA